MNLKGSEIARLEFELAYYDIAVQYINRYINGISPYPVFYLAGNKLKTDKAPSIFLW